MLTVNRLAPYESWEEFYPKIALVLSAYYELNGIEKITRLGFRYINKINRQGKQGIENVSQVLKLHPTYPPELGENFITINSVNEFLGESENERLIIQTNTLKPDSDGEAPILLDISYVNIAPTFVSKEDVNDWLVLAHEKASNAFEAVITEDYKKEIK